jgi:hypothetical protein
MVVHKDSSNSRQNCLPKSLIILMSAQLWASCSTAMIRSLRSCFAYRLACLRSHRCGDMTAHIPETRAHPLKPKRQLGRRHRLWLMEQVQSRIEKSSRWAAPSSVRNVIVRIECELVSAPFGVSITTRSNCLSFASKGLSRVGSANPFFLPICSPRKAHVDARETRKVCS